MENNCHVHLLFIYVYSIIQNKFFKNIQYLLKYVEFYCARMRNINVVPFQSLRKLSLADVSICLAHLKSCKLPKLQHLDIIDCIVDLSIQNKQAKQQICTMLTRLTSLEFTGNRLKGPTIERRGRKKMSTFPLSLHVFLSIIFQQNLHYTSMKMKTMEFDLDNEMIKGSNHVNLENNPCGLSFSNLSNLTIRVDSKIAPDNKDWSWVKTSKNILLSSTTATNNCNDQALLMNESIDKMDNDGDTNILKLESFSFAIKAAQTIDDLELACNSMFTLVEWDSLKRLCITHDSRSNSFNQFCKMIQFYHTFMENHYKQRKKCELHLNLCFINPDNIDDNATEKDIQTVCEIVIKWWHKVPTNAQMQVEFSTCKQMVATLMEKHLKKLLANDASDSLVISKVKDSKTDPDVQLPQRSCVHMLCRDTDGRWNRFGLKIFLM